MMSRNFDSDNSLPNRKRFALLTVALFMFLGLATVSASTIEKEDGATTYDSADESAMNSETQYGYDGSGVNIDNPEYGVAGSELSRYSERYPTTDGENLTFWDRPDVPNPREISNSLCHEYQSHPDSQGLSDYNWLWGQFITHEIDHTTTQDGRTPDQDQPDTAYIPISENDEWMGFPGGLQMRFFRSLVANGTGDGDPLNQREHPNTITTWIDGSVVYGSDAARADWLRENRGGRMKVSDYEEGDLLPQANYAEDPTTPGMSFAGFNFSNSFVAGDGRANEHVALLSMHTLFVREHNRLAGEILDRNPDWSDEQIYQYARHINIGLIESITYNEFLPSLGIELDDYEGYNSTIDPSISNEFATVAFRMGHSQIGSTMFRLNETRMPSAQGHLTLREGFFDVSPITEGGGIAPILRGLAYNVQPENDLMFVDDLRNQMFGPPGAGGMDLCAIDTQRGRDHGIPDFNTVREAFGLARYTNWSDFTSDNATIEALNSTYPDVDSVDAFIGMLAEDHIENSALGETMHVIIKEQFERLRDGDRLYYGSEFSELADIQDQIDNTTLASDIYRLGAVTYKNTGSSYPIGISEVNTAELTNYNLSLLTRPTVSNPAYVRSSNTSITIYPTTLTSGSSVSYNYVKNPVSPKWTYNVVLGKAVYNGSASDAKDFELH
ncbi:MAG: peroxidase family protein, partial [Candidatus Thalassarchaeaceae archaeon]|nr:peroxidase family protein [Candidatus Thalassarchaeaceae archaeon]